jgi:DNA-binding NarL/FixJ family response regulator
LDATSARTILVIAPAGYGKTVLTRQWLKARTSAWFHTEAAASDVAALAAGVGEAAAAIVPGADAPLLRHLHAVQSPSSEAVPLAKTLARELTDWPEGAWLAIDDYHFAMASARAEAFLETLMLHSPVRIILTSRRRPRWASTRRSLYGEILEIGQTKLAFQEDEVLHLLRDMSPSRALSIHALSRGWPAVIALAAHSPFSELPSQTLPATLHRFFAEELFQAAEPELQAALLRLAFLPQITLDLASVAVGPEARSICDEATMLGFLVSGIEGSYELHPLLRRFLVSKSHSGCDHNPFIEDIVMALINAHRFDDAFSVLEGASRGDLLSSLFDAALGPLLAANRLETLSRWIMFGRSCSFVSPVQDLAEAELARRAGDGSVGEARALQALQGLTRSEHRYRAYLVAGGCAQHDIRMEDASDYFCAAAQVATTSEEAIRALWGQFVAELELERGDLTPIVEEICTKGDKSPMSMLRSGTIALILAWRNGRFEQEALAQARKAPLARRDVDPFVNTQFLYRLAYSHVMSAYYREALEIATDAYEEARATGLDFAIPHVLAAQAAAYIGLRNFRASRLIIDKLLRQATKDHFEASNAVLLEARLAVCQNQGAATALRLLETAREPPTRALRGEYLGLRALVLASMGHARDCVITAQEAESATIEVQARSLAGLARAVAAHSSAPTEHHPEIDFAIEAVKQTEDYDNLVCAYRLYPPLLEAISKQRPDFEPALQNIVGRAADVKAATAAGLSINVPTHQTLLSRREREVYELVCEGLRNKEIAAALFISDSTVKVHVRHIFEKLGVRSRAQAILKNQEA